MTRKRKRYHEQPARPQRRHRRPVPSIFDAPSGLPPVAELERLSQESGPPESPKLSWIGCLQANRRLSLYERGARQARSNRWGGYCDWIQKIKPFNDDIDIAAGRLGLPADTVRAVVVGHLRTLREGEGGNNLGGTPPRTAPQIPCIFQGEKTKQKFHRGVRK